MPAFTASAPGKIILFGEHAVVYGRPAIAAPVNQVRARAVVSAAPRAAPGQVRIQAPDIALEADLDELPADNPLALAVRCVFLELGITRPPAFSLRVTSTIPVASGLGSGAAVSVAILRAVSAFLGHLLADERVSALAFEVEKLYHGTPSGIDNTVITYNLPVYFVRGKPLETLHVPVGFSIVIADTGIASPTARSVSDVRKGWQVEPQAYEAIFDRIGQIARLARSALESGNPDDLGSLMDENHSWLSKIGVSSPELDMLVQAARGAGASGAKLSGGGQGGNMIALVTPENAGRVVKALLASGATRAMAVTIP